MFSLKATSNSYDLLSYDVSEMVIKTRSSVIKDVFLSVEAIHEEAYEYSRKMNEIENDESEPNDQYALKMHELDHFFFRINRTSTILGLYAFLESTMMAICTKKQKELGLKLTVDQLSGNGVIRCKEYLESFDVFKFSDPEIKKYWDYIPSFNKLRNALAHAEGNINNFTKLSNKKVEEIKGLHIENGSTIMMSRQYVIDHIENVRDFLLVLCK
jgi:hypothetical protein